MVKHYFSPVFKHFQIVLTIRPRKKIHRHPLYMNSLINTHILVRFATFEQSTLLTLSISLFARNMVHVQHVCVYTCIYIYIYTKKLLFGREMRLLRRSSVSGVTSEHVTGAGQELFDLFAEPPGALDRLPSGSSM